MFWNVETETWHSILKFPMFLHCNLLKCCDRYLFLTMWDIMSIIWGIIFFKREHLCWQWLHYLCQTWVVSLTIDHFAWKMLLCYHHVLCSESHTFEIVWWVFLLVKIIFIFSLQACTTFSRGLSHGKVETLISFVELLSSIPVYLNRTNHVSE